MAKNWIPSQTWWRGICRNVVKAGCMKGFNKIRERILMSRAMGFPWVINDNDRIPVCIQVNPVYNNCMICTVPLK